jgi:cell division protein FtsI (penicillin-binding protein 3)
MAPPRRPAPQGRPHRTRQPVPGRARAPRRAPVRRPAPARPAHNHHGRVVTVRLLLVAALVAAGVKLVQVQWFEADALAAAAERQRITKIDVPATRGAIVDRNGNQLAFSVETRELAFQPKATRKSIATYNKEHPDAKLDFDQRTEEIARGIRELVGDRVDEGELLEKLRSDKSYVYLVDNVEPGIARQLQERFPEIIAEYRAEREYPGGSLAANIVGVANWRMEDPNPDKHNLHGLSGLEILWDKELAGQPGKQIADTEEGNQGVVIPGTNRDLQPAVDGSDIQLTVDADLQFYLQQAVADYVARSGAKNGSAVVMDAHTGEIYALANDKTFDPTDPNGFDPDLMGNPAVSTPYEPGSVNKIVTALSAIEQGVTTPLDVHQVPGSIRVADRTIGDAWSHGTLNMTTTGVFAKSSNVGTLQLAQQVGPDAFAAMLDKLGLGERTGVGLPGESPGRVPPRGQWSGSTFGNLPIGQGLSMTVLQMAGMYQTLANDGVRVPPRIVSSHTAPDGTRVPEPEPEGVRVVSPETAKTVRDMFRAVVQEAPHQNTGTGPAAALPGYQISGKTGTAQQVDPTTGKYSNDLYWITFAGILPADNPRFVVGIMLDKPNYSGVPEGRSAAPLFHDIASFLAQRYNIPLSKEASPVVPLIEP